MFQYTTLPNTRASSGSWRNTIIHNEGSQFPKESECLDQRQIWDTVLLLSMKSHYLLINLFRLNFEEREKNSVSRHLKERSFCVLNILCLFLFVCFVCCIVNLHIWITCEIKWNVLFLILSEFLESSKNQRMCLVTVALKDLDVFVHGRIPEENVEISSPHPQSSALILWTRLAHSLVANQTMFKGWGRGGDYWHEEEESRMKWYNHA